MTAQAKAVLADREGAGRLSTLDLPSPQRVKRLWNRLKEWRAVATRYEKTAASFMGVLCLAAVFGWIKKDIKP